MAKSDKQINKEAGVGDNDSSLAVVAYRTAQLEINQEKRFDSLSQQLKQIVEGFVTEKEMIEARKEGSEEHKRLWDAITGIKSAARWWLTFIFVAIGATASLILALKK